MSQHLTMIRLVGIIMTIYEYQIIYIYSHVRILVSCLIKGLTLVIVVFIFVHRSISLSYESLQTHNAKQKSDLFFMLKK